MIVVVQSTTLVGLVSSTLGAYVFHQLYWYSCKSLKTTILNGIHTFKS